MSKVRDILGVDKESEFLQSFVRSGLAGDNDETENYKSIYSSSKTAAISKQSIDIRSDSGEKSPIRSKSSPAQGNRMRRGRRREYFEEMYTDKDRAAAVSYGYISFHFERHTNEKKIPSPIDMAVSHINFLILSITLLQKALSISSKV